MGKMTAADGNPVTHSGCKNGGVHNQSECGILQSDGLLWNEFWAPSGVYTAKYYQDFPPHQNGEENVYLKFVQDPSCKVKEAGTYDAAYTPDADQLEKLGKYWTVGDCGTQGIPTYLTITVDGTKHLATRGVDDPVTGYPTWGGSSLVVDWTDSVVDFWRINYSGRTSDYQTESPIPTEGAWPDMTGPWTVFVEWGDQTALLAVDSNGDQAIDNTGDLAEGE